MKRKVKKDVGLPNLFPYKEDVINQLERKSMLDKEQLDLLRSAKQAEKMIPGGTMVSYAEQVKG